MVEVQIELIPQQHVKGVADLVSDREQGVRYAVVGIAPDILDLHPQMPPVTKTTPDFLLAMAHDKQNGGDVELVAQDLDIALEVGLPVNGQHDLHYVHESALDPCARASTTSQDHRLRHIHSRPPLVKRAILAEGNDERLSFDAERVGRTWLPFEIILAACCQTGNGGASRKFWQCRDAALIGGAPARRDSPAPD